MSLGSCLLVLALFGQAPATVNGEPISAESVESFARLRGLSADELEAQRPRVLERMIERELVRQFLEQRRVEVTASLVEDRVEMVYRLLRRGQKDPDAVLERSGLDRDRLAEQIRLDLAWQKYARLTITPEDQRKHFEAHRARFDGTVVQARQIVLAYQDGETAGDAPQTREAAERLRQQILDGSVTFADAAREHSTAPSAENGGSLGWIGARGDVLREIAEAALALENGEISQPIATAAGMHLVQVTDRRPGELSLEDARPAVMKDLSESLWRATVRELRDSATIECPACD